MNRQSIAIARQLLAGAVAGLQFGGTRNIYEAAGYPAELTFEDNWARYLRGDIAARVIEAAPIESWSTPPEVLDGTEEEKAKSNTQFARAVDALASGRFDVDSEFLGLWQVLRDLDVQSGIGRYGCLLLGFDDKVDTLAEPVEKGRANRLLWATVYNEGNAGILETEKSPLSPRYGLPTYYELSTETGDSIRAHWTRVIHAAEGGPVYGMPRLQRVWNRLMDLDKILAGGGEGAWRMLVPRYVATTRDDYEIDDSDASEAEIDEFIHNLRNWLALEGVNVQEFAGAIADPSPAVRGYISIIAGAIGIPQRLLIGSERGELASSMDEATFAKRIDERRGNYVNSIIKRTLNRLIYAGVLPSPSGGGIFIKWESLLKLDDNELADLAEKIARTLTILGIDVNPESVVRELIPRLDAKDIEEKEEAPVSAQEPSPADIEATQHGDEELGPEIAQEVQGANRRHVYP